MADRSLPETAWNAAGEAVVEMAGGRVGPKCLVGVYRQAGPGGV